MREFLENSSFFAVLIGLAFYFLGDFLRKKTKQSLISPLLISILSTILLLVILDIDYDKYAEGAKYLSYLLTPTTVCLAIPLYRRISVLKHNKAAIILGVAAGSFASLICIFGLSLLFGLTHEEYVSMLPKSITSAIAFGVTEELGGNLSIIAAALMITGNFGNLAGEFLLKLFRITEPVAKGIALGTSSHAVGTSKALEIGETEGAVSSLAVVVAGIVTVAGVPIFAQLI